MGSMQVKSVVRAPVSDVFAAFSDFANAPGRVKGIKRIEMLTQGPVGVGTKFKETRTMFKSDATETMEVVEFAKDKSYTLGCNSCGCVFRSAFQFRPTGDGTEVEMDFSWKSESFLAKLMAPISAIMMKPMKKCIEGDITDLKTYLEANKPVS